MTRNAVSARLALIGAAGRTVTYGELARNLGLRMGELTATLELLMEEDAALGRPLRAAVCAARLGAGHPAPGFFKKAAALGFDVSDPTGFVAQHRAAMALTHP